jgi:phosphoribosyl 1,2-cyclic phosphodiesterase
MIVRFWGVRGSIPAPMSSHEVKAKIAWAFRMAMGHNLGDEGALKRFVDELPQHIGGTYGGNTPCVQLQSGDTTIIFDAGSGIRALGLDLMEGSFGQGTGTCHLFLSHTHWDHIQGLPFFLPAHVPGNRIIIYSPHADIEKRLKAQQAPAYFPVPLESMEADIEFFPLTEPETIRLDELSVSSIGLKHPGGSFGYRVEKQGASFVYATDTALNDLSESDQKQFIPFFSHAKVVVIDAQYTAEEAASKETWGHSSPFAGVDMALRTEVETLVLFHHEPTHDDQALHEKFERARKYVESKRQNQTCTVLMAYEGLQLTV